MTNLDTKALEAAREAYDAPLLPHMTLRERMFNKVSDEREISIRIRLAIEAYLSAASPPPSGEAGEDEGGGHCAKCGLDWDAPASAPRCDECPPAAVEPRKRAEALTEEILKIMRGARAYLPVYSKEAIVELLVGALPTIKEPTDGK